MGLRTLAASIAERQLGLVARRQLVAGGIPDKTIDAAVWRGQLLPVRRGVYRLPGVPETPETRLLARTLAAGDGAQFSFRSAAWLWTLLDEAPRRHIISVPGDRRPRDVGATVHRSRDLHLAIPGTVRGVPVTGVGRTILDCAADPTIDVELLIDAAHRHHKISRTLLPATIVAHARQGRPGIRRLRDLVVDAEIPHSDFERLVGRWLRDEGIGRWVLHHRIVVPGFGPVELDYAWPDSRVALELEGADHRDRRAVHDNDTERQNWIVLAGFTVVRTTYRRWIRHTTRVRHEIEAALALAGQKPRTAPLPPAWVPSTDSGLWIPRT